MPLKENLKLIFFTRHPYHLTDPSPWLFLASSGIFMLTVGLVRWMHKFVGEWSLVLNGLILILYVLATWRQDIIKKVRFEEQHKMAVRDGLLFGMFLFLISEIMFLEEFFHSSLSPVFNLKGVWPPKLILPVVLKGIFLTNTFLWLSSGATVILGQLSSFLGAIVTTSIINSFNNNDFLLTIFLITLIFLSLFFYELLKNKSYQKRKFKLSIIIIMTVGYGFFNINFYFLFLTLISTFLFHVLLFLKVSKDLNVFKKKLLNVFKEEGISFFSSLSPSIKDFLNEVNISEQVLTEALNEFLTLWDYEVIAVRTDPLLSQIHEINGTMAVGATSKVLVESALAAGLEGVDSSRHFIISNSLKYKIISILDPMDLLGYRYQIKFEHKQIATHVSCYLRYREDYFGYCRTDFKRQQLYKTAYLFIQLFETENLITKTKGCKVEPLTNSFFNKLFLKDAIIKLIIEKGLRKN